MYIISNAIKNLKRNKSRNILVGIIIFILILSTTISMIINTTSKEIIDNYKDNFGSKVNISIDMEKWQNSIKIHSNQGNGSISDNKDKITAKQYMEFSKSEYLKSYKINGQLMAGLSELEAIDENIADGLGSKPMPGYENSIEVKPTVNLLSYSDLNSIPSFNDGFRKIIDGKMYKNINECVISSEFANLNSLKVGDKIEIINFYDNNQAFNLIVSGIYADGTEEYGNIAIKQPSLNRRNEILTSTETMKPAFDNNTAFIKAEYELYSPEYLVNFEKEVRTKGLKDFYKVSTDEEDYNKIVAPVQGLSKISTSFMVVVLGLGVAILLIISAIAIRERKYEIGVLRAMGMKKSKLACMFMAETIAITVICLTIGLGSGSIVAQPIADSMIQVQVEIAQRNENNQSFGETTYIADSSNKKDIKPISEIDIYLKSEAVMQICFIAIFISLITSSMAVISITKYEPMKILSERN